MLLKIDKTKSKRGIGLKIKNKSQQTNEFQVKEIFVGHKTLFTFAGVATGSTLIGRSIWELLYRDMELGFINTVIIGAILLSISGFYIGNYHEENREKTAKRRARIKKA